MHYFGISLNCNFPCTITGAVGDETQSEATKKEIRNTVDAMMHSVQTKE